MSDEGGLTRRAALLLMASGASAGLAKTVGFTSALADRSTTVDVAGIEESLLAIIHHEQNVVDHRNKATSIATIRNNADRELSLDVAVPRSPGVQAELESDDPLPPGGETDLTATCESGSDREESQVTVDVRSAESSDLSVYNASRTITVQLNCSGGGNSGFKSASADGIPTGDSEQTFRFEPKGNLKKGEVRIDLSDPRRNGVEYGENPTVRTDGGSAERNGSEIVFAPPNSGAKGVVEIAIGVSAPSGSTGTYDVSFTRTDQDRTAWASFSVSSG